ncbi:hypothetical protein FOA52_013956 [Chlamydomonas sp. UWO 241]|nr:hypothetical protein FOA52_013956 [Chlamydomonas sp. UWO 241]
MFTRAGMLSPEGRCKTLDAGADGYVRSEAAAVLALTTINADSDGRGGSSGGGVGGYIAILCGSAVNQDGRSSALTAPSGPAQQAVVRAALGDACVGADALALLQMHGTGGGGADDGAGAAVLGGVSSFAFQGSNAHVLLAAPSMLSPSASWLSTGGAAAAAARGARLRWSRSHMSVLPPAHSMLRLARVRGPASPLPSAPSLAGGWQCGGGDAGAAQVATLVFEADLGHPDTAWLHDHVVGGRIIVPGACYLEVALAAARLTLLPTTAPSAKQQTNSSHAAAATDVALVGVSIQAPLMLVADPAAPRPALRVELDLGSGEFSVTSHTPSGGSSGSSGGGGGGSVVTHVRGAACALLAHMTAAGTAAAAQTAAAGVVQSGGAAAAAAPVGRGEPGMDAWRARTTVPLDTPRLNADLAGAGLQYGRAPPPAKVKFFKGNFKMTTTYKFAADFADAAIESLKERFFDDDPSLDILACFTIFDPVQYIGMRHAELDDFGNDSFQQLQDHFWSGDGLPNSPFSARGESFMATLDTEFKHVKTVIKDRLALTPSATMLNLWRFIARSSDSLMVPNIILLMNVYYVMALHTAEVERGFSIHRILKNRLRSRLVILMVDSLLRIWHLAQSFTSPRESENNSLINEAAEKLSGASLQSQGVNPPSLLKRLVEEVSRVQVSFLDRDLDEAARLLEKEGLEDVDPAVAFDVEGNIVEEEDAGEPDELESDEDDFPLIDLKKR